MARKTENYRYAIIPAGAITDPRVEPRALQVLCLLGRHANDNGWCRRSQVKMAEELNCGRTTINRAIELLLETGYIERQEQGRGSAKPQPGKQPFAAYAYRVRLDRSDKEIQDVAEGGVHQRTPEGGCPPADTGVSTQADTGVSTSRTPLTEHTPVEDAPEEQAAPDGAGEAPAPSQPTLDLGNPTWLPEAEWEAFVAMRKKIRAPLTDYAKALAIKDLDKLRQQGHDPAAVLNQSTLKCWKGLFALKPENGNGTGNNSGGGYLEAAGRFASRFDTDRTD